MFGNTLVHLPPMKNRAQEVIFVCRWGSRQHDKFPGDRLNMVAAVLSSDVKSSVETGDRRSKSGSRKLGAAAERSTQGDFHLFQCGHQDHFCCGLVT
jgi:hypothetical protein